MTPLKKAVTRRSEELYRDSSKFRRIVVTLYPAAVNDCSMLAPQGTVIIFCSQQRCVIIYIIATVFSGAGTK